MRGPADDSGGDGQPARGHAREIDLRARHVIAIEKDDSKIIMTKKENKDTLGGCGG